MKGTKIELSTNNDVDVKETFKEVQNAVRHAEIMNKRFVLLTDLKTKTPIMININHIICF